MKYIISILICALSISSMAQTKTLINPPTGNRNTITHFADGLSFDSLFLMRPSCGTPTWNMTPYMNALKFASIALDSCNNVWYGWNPATNTWSAIGNGSGSGGLQHVVATNGLTNVNDSTIKLGGSLTANTTIPGGAFSLSLTGNLTGNTLNVSNVNTSGNAISSSGQIISTINNASKRAVNASNTNASGTALEATGTSTTNPTAIINKNFTGVSTATALRLNSNNSNSGDGAGIYQDFTMSNSSTLTRTTNRFLSRWNNAATDISEFVLYGLNSISTPAETPLLSLLGTGAAKLDQYGHGTFTGTPAYTLQVDANGNIIEGTGNTNSDTAGLIQGVYIFINNADSTYKPNGSDVVIDVDTASIHQYVVQVMNNDTTINNFDSSDVTYFVDSLVCAPPPGPVNGDIYLICNTGATGDFAGKETQIVERVGGAWAYTVPDPGDIVAVNNPLLAYYKFNGTIWNFIRFTVSWGGDRLGTAGDIGNKSNRALSLVTNNNRQLTITGPGKVRIRDFRGADTALNFVYVKDSVTGELGVKNRKELVAGTGITITPSATADTIKATGGGSGGVVFDSLTWISAQNWGILPGNSEATNTTNASAAIDYLQSVDGGTLYFPYASTPYNVQIIIPGQDPDDGWIPIRIIGATPPSMTFGTVLSFDFHPEGAILQSASTSGSVIEAQEFSGGFSFITLYIENLEIRTSPDPQINGVNALSASQLLMNNVFINTNIYNVQAIEPTHNTSGVITPGEGNGAYTNLTNVAVTGYKNGVYVNEHTSGTDVTVASCYNGITISKGPHASHFNRLGMYRNHFNIVKDASGGNAFFKIEQMNVEHAAPDQVTDSTDWQETVYDIVDVSNELHGSVSYESTLGGIGHLSSLTTNGAIYVSSGDAGVVSDYRVPFTVTNKEPASLAAVNVKNDLNKTAFLGMYGSSAAFNAGYARLSSDTALQIATLGKINIATAAGGNSMVINAGNPGNIEILGQLAVGTPTATAPLTVSGTSTPMARITNTNAGSFSALNIENSSSGIGQLFKTGGSYGGYKNIQANDFGIYSGSGNMSFLNDAGNFNFAAGGSGSPQVTFSTTGIVTMAAYGAGAATFDASGVISSVSDERVKNILGKSKAGLKAIMNINPIYYRYNGLSGNETQHTYVGFSAQNVKDNIPYGTGETKDGYLTLQDRALMAAMVNAIKEQQAEIDELKKEINQLKRK